MILINWLFLLLDEIFFFQYRKVKIKKSVFIIGVPRSATTFIFNVLYKNKEHFHGFKLWELVFAPSIIQKYLILFITSLDHKIGSPIFKLSKLFDQIVFGKFREIHDIGLTKPEEDEVLFLYNFSSLYYYYFFPGLKVLDNFLYHDMKMPEKVKKSNINFYYRCIQRHNFVFDREGSKYFISKNPTFIPKMESIASKFDKAKFIYPMRSPYNTIPSTISLNAHIYSNFSKLPEPYPYQNETRDFILKWYVHADKIIKTKIQERCKTVYYKDLLDHTLSEFLMIYDFLNIKMNGTDFLKDTIVANTKSHKNSHQYSLDLGISKEIIEEDLKHILTSEIINKI